MGKILPLFFIFIFTSNLHSQQLNSWELQNYFSYKGSVNDLIYFPSNKIIAVGDYGEIYYSENDGIDISIIPTGSTYHLKSLTFKDSLLGFASGNGGTILKTTDGGKNWESLNSGIIDNIFDIELNDNYLIAVGEKGKILKSTDDGLTWSLKHFNSSYYLLAVKLFNKDTGNAVGSEGVILRTTNAGETWSQQNSGVSFRGQFTSIDTRFDKGFIAGDSGYVLRSFDGGDNWEDVDTSHSFFGGVLYTIKIANDSVIYAAGHGMRISTNGGITFNYGGFNSYGLSDIKNLEFLKKDSLYISGTKGISLYRGAFTNTLRFPLHLSHYVNISVIDSKNCWINGGNGKDMFTVYNTTNGGDSWSFNKINEYENDFYSLAFLNKDTGFIQCRLNYPGQILRTIDGGSSWHLIRDSLYFWKSTDIRFKNNLMYLIKDNQIHRFDFEGNLIDTIPRPFGLPGYNYGYYQVTDFFLVGDSTIYMIGGNSLYKSSNNGQDWTFYTHYFYQNEFKDCFFYSEDYGFFVGSKSAILKTTGTSLPEEIKTGNPETDLVYNDVEMSDYYNVHIVGNDGIIYHSTDGGQTWELRPSGVTTNLNKIAFYDSKTGWIVGDNGVILKTTTGGSHWENESNELPVKYVLYQNYPNPFNPATTISFDIPDDIGNGFIRTKLAVYDIAGREVRVIVDQDLQTNSYSYSFDASSLPSGVYFYKLSAGNEFSQTKKMLLIK